MKKHKVMDFSQITDDIFIGTNFCCTTHFDKRLLAKGVRADISLEDKRVDTPFGVGYFLWLPTKDKTAPTQTRLAMGADALNHLVSAGIKTYVHCKNGHGRAPTLVAAYFLLTGMGVEEAIEKIAQKRPEVHLEKPQIKALKDFKKSIIFS